ncbi:MAG: hypothetical protein FWG59_03230, partial [Betaproteobacteria bacterium]|nr:hypothetical protein [Betaproteobacteria bacterium]
MRRIWGFFVVIASLIWPGTVLGQEYTFGQGDSTHNTYSGASAGNSGKLGFYLAPRFLDSLTNTGDINGSGGRASRTYNTVGGAIAAGYY